jgi:demethylmenaquinone methyltransferase/2-methoxy-6-polyprenyl-1,4-benzoquinol methylase
VTDESQRLMTLYEGKQARRYDSHVSRLFGRYKGDAFNESSLKTGDKVLVFCCGTGLDFPFILEKIGKEGLIVGVDFSPDMLQVANEKVIKNKWENVELAVGDVTEYVDPGNRKFDAGVCTLGISVIPDYRKVYYNLRNHIRSGGELIVGDVRTSSGKWSFVNPLMVLMAKKFGGSREGHQNSAAVCTMMAGDLTDFRKKEFFFNSYFYAIGRTR